MTTNFSLCVGFSAFVATIVFLLSVTFLLPVILDMTKSFYIKKRVTSIHNITDKTILKSIIYNARVFFSSLEKI